jgi:prophage antirepressor-like protein
LSAAHQSQDTAVESTRSGYTFHGRIVRELDVFGKRCRIAREVGKALDYEQDGKQFVQNLTTEWANEIREGEHWFRLKGADLRQTKENLRLGTAHVPSQIEGGGEPPPSSAALSFRFANELVVITEEGINLALMKSGKPLAIEFRAWLAGEVVPAIAATGKYDPAPTRGAMLTAEEIATIVTAAVAKVLDARPAVAASLPSIGSAGGRTVKSKLGTYAQIMSRGDARERRSWRSTGDVELRERVQHFGSGKTWEALPWEKLSQATTALDEMIKRAEKVFPPQADMFGRRS